MTTIATIATDIAERDADSLTDAIGWLVLERGALIEMHGGGGARFTLEGFAGSGPDPASALRDWAQEVLWADALARGAA